MDIQNFLSAINQVAEEKGISAEKVIETIEMAIAAAYKKDYGKKGQIIKAKLEPKTGGVKFWQVKEVVSPDMIYSEEDLEEMKRNAEANKIVHEETSFAADVESKKIRFNSERHIMMEEAQKIKPEVQPGEELEFELETRQDYGRIAAQTAKQVILQKIREAEREMVLKEFKSKEGEIISGIVQRIEDNNVFLDIGKTVGILPREEQAPGEFYRIGQRLKVYILKVEENPRGSIVFLSRAYPKLVSKLFELEVPEISQQAVLIKAIAREAGSRSKVAVESKVEGVDPIGSAVGQRGTRVMAVIAELGGEKIDIIEYSEDPSKFIANALAPAKVVEVKLLDKNRAICLVPEDQLSLAIGKDGQNVRLAARLTGWKIDIKSPDSETAVSAESVEPAKEETAEPTENTEVVPDEVKDEARAEETEKETEKEKKKKPDKEKKAKKTTKQKKKEE